MRELEREWSFKDMVQAHQVLDALEEAEAEAYEAAKAKAGAS